MSMIYTGLARNNMEKNEALALASKVFKNENSSILSILFLAKPV